MTKIFISYRREDSVFPVLSINETLKKHYGDDSVALGGAYNKAEFMGQHVSDSDVLLAIVGDRWLDMQAADGTRRIDDPRDFVRIEIQIALKRKIPIIPVLVGNASMPTAAQLPRGLKQLSRLQAAEVCASVESLPQLERLVGHIDAKLSKRRRPPVEQPALDAEHAPETRLPDSPRWIHSKRIYRVWYGTDRKPLVEGGRVKGFSARRGRDIHYGSCLVAIPKSHEIGSIGSPWWRRWLTWTDDRLRLVELAEQAQQEFWSTVNLCLAELQQHERVALVFIHGFNVTFEQAALRAAQIGFDLKVPGITAFYSWPSRGTVAGYAADGATIAASELYIADFLSKFATEAGVERVHVLAHSMGNRGLLYAMRRMVERVADTSPVPLGQIFLAAPDIDCDEFCNLAKVYPKLSQRTTLYVSSTDRTLASSGIIHDHPRAGFTPPVTVVPGIDTVEVSDIDMTLLGHGYYAAARDLLHDMFNLMRSDTSPEKRMGLLSALTTDRLPYWVFLHKGTKSFIGFWITPMSDRICGVSDRRTRQT